MLLAALTRLSFFSQSPNTIACWIGVLLIIAFSLPDRARLFAVILLFAALGMTQSRSALVTLLPITFLWFACKRNQPIEPALRVAIICGITVAVMWTGINGRLGHASLSRSSSLRLDLAKVALARYFERNFLDNEIGLGLGEDAAIRYQSDLTIEQISVLALPLSSLLLIQAEERHGIASLLLVALFAPAFSFILPHTRLVDGGGNSLRNFLRISFPAVSAHTMGCALFNDLHQDGTGRAALVLVFLGSGWWLISCLLAGDFKHVLISVLLAVTAVGASVYAGYYFYYSNLRRLGIPSWKVSVDRTEQYSIYSLSGPEATAGTILILSPPSPSPVAVDCVGVACDALREGWKIIFARGHTFNIDTLIASCDGRPIRMIAIGGWLPQRFLERSNGCEDRFVIVNPSEISMLRTANIDKVHYLISDDYRDYFTRRSGFVSDPRKSAQLSSQSLIDFLVK